MSTLLVADIGGTNVKIGFVVDGIPQPYVRLFPSANLRDRHPVVSLALMISIAIDEARVENDTESLRQEEMIRLLCRQGEVVEGGKVDPMYHHHLRLPRHRQCMDRMREEDQDMVLDRELRKDHVEVAMAGVTMAERTQAAAALVEIETMTCH